MKKLLLVYPSLPTYLNTSDAQVQTEEIPIEINPVPAAAPKSAPPSIIQDSTSLSTPFLLHTNSLEKSPSLPQKAQLWVKDNQGLAIGGAAGTAVLAGLIASAYPLWKKIIKPRLVKLREGKLTGGKHPHAKRDVEDEYFDEVLSNPEFLEFLEGWAAELE